MIQRILTAFAVVVISVIPSTGNTPGKHTVLLTWTNGVCSTSGTCTTNVYRGTSAGVCSGTPTPLASLAVSGTGGNAGTYTDQNPPTGAVYYNVSNVDPAKGGESTCNGEVQVTVSPITTPTDSGLAGVVQ